MHQQLNMSNYERLIKRTGEIAGFVDIDGGTPDFAVVKDDAVKHWAAVIKVLQRLLQSFQARI